MNNKKVVRLLLTIRKIESQPNWNYPAFITAEELGMTIPERDDLLIEMQACGLISGLSIADDIDNVHGHEILWSLSEPGLTFDGIRFLVRQTMPMPLAQ